MMPAIFKKKPWNIIIAVLLVAVIGIGIYGTVFGVKEAIRMDKKADRYNNGLTTEQEAVVTDTKKIYKNTEYEITLTEDFDNEETDVKGGDFVSDAVEVVVNVEYFNNKNILKNITEREYIEESIKKNGNPASVIRETESGLIYVEYIYNRALLDHYYVFAVKGEEAFYFVNFMFRSSDKERLTPYIINWAESFVPYK